MVPRPEGKRAKKEKKHGRSAPQKQHHRQEPPRKKSGGGRQTSNGPTLGQKLIRLLTLGLVRPGRSTAPQARGLAADAPKKLTTPVPPSHPDDITGTRLHIGNLHYNIEEDDLLDLFKGVGPVRSVDIVYCSRTYRSKGEGFVEFMTLEDARRAVEELHGQLYMRRPLHLGPAKPRGEDEREKDSAGEAEESA